ncbi:MAG: outer membrane lipoprotein carrier protein LolA [Terracidiphilus sp.]
MRLAGAVLCGSLLSASALVSAGQGAGMSAQELAQRVDRHYDTLHSLTANFQESYEGLGMKRVESGTLLVSKPGRMKWEYGSPAGKLFLLDGKYAWFYTPGNPQVQRIPAKELDDLRSPLRFLLGHTELEKELSGLHEAPGAAGSGEKVLIGQPKGQEKRVSRVTLAIDPATYAIAAMEIDETDGAITRFTFTDQKPDVPMPADTFRFRAPAGVEVVDAPPPV